MSLPSTIPDTPALNTLDRGVAQELLHDALEAIGSPDEGSEPQRAARYRSAMLMLEALKPRDALEAMIAVQVVGNHFAALTCLRGATGCVTASVEAARLRASAISLQRGLVTMVTTLDRRHAEPRPAARTSRTRAEPAPDNVDCAVMDLPESAPDPALPPLNPVLRERPPVSAPAGSGLAPRPHTPAPLAPFWETLTPAQRRERYGYKVPDSFLRSAPEQVLRDVGLVRPVDPADPDDAPPPPPPMAN